MNAVLTNAVSAINDLLWNKWLLLLFLLLGSGIFFSFRTGFVQVRKFKEGLRLVFGNISLRGKKAGKDGMSSFQALATAIAAQVGTGNIAGCATALVAGSPGAVFWMWVSAFFGMATIYGEAVLAQRFKKVGKDGEVLSGPIYYNLLRQNKGIIERNRQEDCVLLTCSFFMHLLIRFVAQLSYSCYLFSTQVFCVVPILWGSSFRKG